MDRPEQPFPVRERDGFWEVAMIDEQDVRYVNCESKEDADLIADARPLHLMASEGRPCDPDRVERCLQALRKYGWDERRPLVRYIMSLRPS